MISTQASMIAATVASLGMAAVEGVSTVQHMMTDSAITGSGVAQSYGGSGETIVIKWTLHKRLNCPGWNSRVWKGRGGFVLTEQKMPTTLPMTSGPREYNIATKIPDLAPLGELELSIVGEYKCKTGGPHVFALGPVSITVK